MKNKKGNLSSYLTIAFLLVAVVIILLFATTRLSRQVVLEVHPSISLSSEELQWLSDHPKLILAVDDGNPPQNFKDDNGKMTGINIDYMNLIAQRLGIEFEYFGESWSIAFGSAMDHEVDGIINANKLPEREVYLNFTEVYTVFDRGVVALKSKIYESFDDMAGMKLAVKKDTSHLQMVENNFPEIELIAVETLDEGFELLLQGEVEGIYDDVTSLDQLITFNKYSNLGFAFIYTPEGSGDSRIGLRNDDALLLSVVNKGIRSITYTDSLHIQKKWIQSSVPSENLFDLELSQEEYTWLNNHPIIRVASDSAWSPIEYVNSEGEFEGIATDYMTLLGVALNVEFEYVYNKTWDELIEMGLAKEVDMFSAVYETEDRKEFLTFTEGYLWTPSAIFVRTDDDFNGDIYDLYGKNVAVVEGYAIAEYISRDFSEVNLVLVENNLEGIRQLREGIVDAYVDNILTTNDLIVREGMTDVRIAGNTQYLESLTMGVRKDWDIFTGILTKAINAIPESEREKIQKRHTSINYAKENPDDSLFIVELVGALIILALLFWNVLQRTELKGQVNHAKHEEVLRVEAETEYRRKVEHINSLWHDLQGPLMSIEKNNRYLTKTSMGASQMDYLQKNMLSTAYISEIIINAGRWHEEEADKISVDSSEFDFLACISTVIDMNRIHAFEKDLKMVVEIQETIPERIEADRYKLMQILMNLIDNAIDTTDIGSVTLQIRVDSSIEDEMLLSFEVIDTGRGMPIKEQKTMQMLLSGESKPNTDDEIRLVRSAELISVCGGQMTFSCTSSMGSIYRFSIKAKEVVGRQYSSITNMSFRLLALFEDSAYSRKILKMFSVAGAKTSLVQSEKDLTSELTFDGDYDYVLIDYESYKTNILYVLNQIKNDNLKVIIVSNVRDRGLDELLLSEDVYRVLYTPLSQKMLSDLGSDKYGLT